MSTHHDFADDQLSVRTAADKATEQAIDLALARQPAPVVPPDFAARVRAALPPVAPVRTRLGAGRTVAVVASAALLVAVFCIAPHTAPSFTSVAFDVELSLLVELACILTWLAQPQRDF